MRINRSSIMARGALAIVAALTLGTSLAACSKSKGGATSAGTTTTAAATTNTSTTGGGAGGSSTTVAGNSANIETGGVGFFANFKYTLTAGSLAPNADDATQQDLSLTFNWLNTSAVTSAQPLHEFDIRLKTSEVAKADTSKVNPDGTVSPGASGTLIATWKLKAAFHPNATTVILGDPDQVDAAVIVLSAGAKGITKEPKDESVTFKVTGARSGASFAVTGAQILSADPTGSAQADKGTAYLMLSVNETAGSDTQGLSSFDVTVLEPDGSAVAASTWLDASGKGVGNLGLSAGQTKPGKLLFAIKDNTKVPGTYTLQLVSDSGTPVSGTFKLT